MSEFKVGDHVQLYQKFYKDSYYTGVIESINGDWHTIKMDEGSTWRGIAAQSMTLLVTEKTDPKALRGRKFDKVILDEPVKPKKLDLRLPVEMCGPAAGEEVMLAVWQDVEHKLTILVTAEDEAGVRFQYRTDAYGMSEGKEHILRNVPESIYAPIKITREDLCGKSPAERLAFLNRAMSELNAKAGAPNTRPVKVRLYQNGAVVRAVTEDEDLSAGAFNEENYIAETTVHVPVKAAEPKFKVGQRVRTLDGDVGVVVGPADFLPNAVEVRDDGTQRIGLWLHDSLTPLKKVKYNVREDGYTMRCAREGSLGDKSPLPIVHTFTLEVEDK